MRVTTMACVEEHQMNALVELHLVYFSSLNWNHSVLFYWVGPSQDCHTPHSKQYNFLFDVMFFRLHHYLLLADKLTHG